MSEINLRKRVGTSFQVYRNVNSSSSDSSTSSSNSDNSDPPLKRFNRLLRSSVARHWAFFRKDQPNLRSRGRSISDACLCSIVDNDLGYLGIPVISSRRSLQAVNTNITRVAVPRLSVTSAGGSGAGGVEEASDGSDAERSRRHLRVPTPTHLGHWSSVISAVVCAVRWKSHMDSNMETLDSISRFKYRWALRRDSLPLVTIRKAWLKSRTSLSPEFSQRRGSTGNFSSGAAGGGCGAPRSAPATPLQLEPHPRSKHDKNSKPLSGSAPSVRGPSGDEATDGKQPSKSRQKKFQRHFPQVGPEERVLNYYSCALVGDLLLQGHLYITKNYFAFYSNVFGYVTKLLIPTTSVLRISKEKVARIIPNAVGVCTRDERHVFGSLLSRDSTYKLMMHVWKSARATELAVPKPPELRTSEVEASEYSPDDSSSGGADTVDAPDIIRPEPEAIIAAASATVIQPALLTGAPPPRRAPHYWHAALLALAFLLTCSATYFAYSLYTTEPRADVSGEELYQELVRWRAKLHGRAAGELHAFLSTNLLLLAKVRQSLEALSGVIMTDMAQGANIDIDIPNETVIS